ncbi:hypothetical protein MPTA5024_18605 [Microbispora sp. ATCC PTA-5024]|nr:hypothetical protein MPTA5024_18605 [Microbispora sp. ATCC PTA-5024]
MIVIQAVRLAYLAATRLAFVEGRPEPDPNAIHVEALVGSLLSELTDPTGPTDTDPMLRSDEDLES